MVPPDDSTAPAADAVLVAGTSGFAHQRQGVDGIIWTDYATGTTSALPGLSTVSASAVLPAGGDAFAFVDTTAHALNVGTPSRGSLSTYPIPTGFTVQGVGENGTRALVGKGATSSGPAQVEVLDLGADGSITPVSVTGLPDGALISPQLAKTDGGTHALVAYETAAGTPLRYALLDLDTGVTTAVPGLTGYVSQLLLTGTDLAWTRPVSGTAVVSMLPQSAILDGSAAAMTPATVTLPGSTAYALAPVGGHLVAVKAPLGLNGQTGAPGSPVLDYPFDGGSPTTLLASDSGFPVVAPDGAVLATGGADTSTSAVHRYTLAADSTLTDATVLPLPPVESQNAGISLAHGVLRHIESYPVLGGEPQLKMFNHGIAADTQPNRVPYGQLSGGTLPTTTLLCASGQQCVRTVDGNGYGTSFLMADSAGKTEIRAQIDGGTSHMTIALPTTGGRLVDASLEYQLVDGGSSGQQYVIDTSHEEIVSTGPITGAALWDETLWQAPTTSAAGTITATNLTTYPSPKVFRTISTGTACRPTELQVSQHWLYWSCGASGPAGVYDLSTGHRIAVPAGQALLGDGYLVRHDATAGQLLLVDFHSGAASAPQVLADLPASSLTDDRGITWTVDRFSGDVAYAGADRSVHVLSTGVPASSPTATAWLNGTWVSPRGGTSGAWNVNIAIDRPVDAWQLTITNAATRKAAYTATGGPSRELLSASWNGRLPDGSLAPSGSYLWQLSATAQGSTAAVHGASGTLTTECGALVFRSYDCDGRQALLAVKRTTYGEAHWWQATPGGRLADNGHTEDWQLGTHGSWETSALVPFGDFNGDGKGDLLVRNGSGVLTAYLGLGQAYFNSTGAKRVRIGTGWNTYNALLSPGDINRDGHDDLLARDGSGNLWFFAGTGKSTFKPRVRISTGWQGYAKLIAAGDLNGDGVGDLLAMDRSGALWRFYGNKHGGFGSRAKISTGWKTYNAIIGIGDLSQDGHNDLAARDAAGNLWRFDGTGAGTFHARVKIGTGWGGYAGLY